MRQLNKEQAEVYVNELYRKAGARWNEKVTESPFMRELMAGKLPMETLRLFFRNWGAWTIEINTLIACSYHKFLPFFKSNRDLMGPMGEKIADEFIHPKPPGHFLVMMETATAFGLNEEEVFNQPMLSEFRAKIDFMRSILYEGTAAEWYAGIVTEESIGYWSASWFEALTKHYGFSREQATYFSTHHEADLEEHEEGVMGHGSFNRMALQRLLEEGMAHERPTFGMEYCALTSVDLHAVMQRAPYEEAERLRRRSA